MPAPPLLKRDWEKDCVYLVQFPRAGCIPSASPFALKLETWLRIVEMKHVNVSNDFTKFSSKKQIPFIELNGRQIADSGHIIEELLEKGDLVIDRHLTELDKATARALNTLVEESIFWCIVYNRSRNNAWFASEKGFLGHFAGIKKVAFQKFFNNQLRKKLVRKCFEQGVGRHSLDEVEEICKKDLKALSTILADNEFFFGSRISTFDATAFGHLAQIYFTPLVRDNLKKFMDEETPNLVAFVNRIKEQYWPDWDEICETLAMNKGDKKPEPGQVSPAQIEEQ
ncbi:hypothetical protein QR680_008782 [Steinernema hermaphroditum]|uniref:GST C-terminal domain-containing protein n=1 Tax=Steinernema hermaphroditum TaxID=289476 RepID=A0AA39M8R0_9BILA|nr:hypothetical protein QR680_008782 [Steinernema hermaphroditum]